ncbi:MAG: glycosyltransferase family 39 protein [Dehalococcoidia bacterium]|nr:glycosyltransferase family 39 protein [Dehalococcoidia bacterium]
MGLAVAVGFGIWGSLLLHDPRMLRFDDALVLYGVALLGLLVFAAGGLPDFEWGWRRRARGFLSQHRVELLLLAAIAAFAVFMRVYRLGTFPPDDGLAFEEHITGGVAYRILQGERPLFYPVRYLVAASLATFGENTFGLRFAGIAMGVLAVPASYLLLRRLVSVPVALFATALLAGAFWPSLHYRVTADAALFTILLALCVVAGAQRRSAVLFVAAGFLAGLLSYEYEPFKAVPFYVVGFLAAAGLWLLFRAAVSGGAAKARSALAAGAKAAWRPAIAFTVAAGIVAAPLMMGEHLGRDIYLSSLHRQEADRENRGTPGLFAPNWETQVKWSAQLFAPVGDDDFPRRTPLTPADRAFIDPMSAFLIVVGLAWTLGTLLRPYRLLFAGWFLGTLMGGALLLSNWEPWKFVGLFPVGLVMAAFFVDDVRAALPPRLTAKAFSLALAALAAFSWAWNADAFFNDAVDEPKMLQAYAHPQSYWYALCDYLRERGPDNFGYSFNARGPAFGLALPRDTPQQEAKAWGDHIWVCHGLQGAALTGPLEGWPLRGEPSGPVTLAYVVAPDLVEPVQRDIAWAYSGLEPDEVKAGPEKLYYLLGYALTGGEIRSRQGLLAEYVSRRGDGTSPVERVDKPHRLSWDAVQAPEPPFSVTWRGLAFLDGQGTWSLRAGGDDPTRVSIDGGQPYVANGLLTSADAPSLAVGWHWVEITLDKESPGGEFWLYWQDPSGAFRHLEEKDLFALAPVEGWLHARTFAIDGVGAFVTQRPASDLAQSALGPLLEETRMLAQGAAQAGKSIDRDEIRLVEERFIATWRVRVGGSYGLALRFEGGEAQVVIDGRQEAVCGPAAHNAVTVCDAAVELAAGEHRVELLLRTDSDTWTGGRLAVSTPSAAAGVDIRPF